MRRTAAVPGFAALDGLEFHHLYVAPDAQRRGVGSALFAQTQAARPSGFEIWVFRDNDRARGLYERHGCRLLRGTDGENEEGAPDVLYEWRPPG
jgi:GNAT superfamily N-acetyltransferase